MNYEINLTVKNGSASASIAASGNLFFYESDNGEFVLIHSRIIVNGEVASIPCRTLEPFRRFSEFGFKCEYDFGAYFREELKRVEFAERALKKLIS